MITLQDETYITQMDSAVYDKEYMFDFINEGPVLDVGCGSGQLTRLLQINGFDAYGIDNSPLSRDINSTGLMRSGKFIHGDAMNLEYYYEKEFFSTIIFSSVLHEVYSYNDFSRASVFKVINMAKRLLKPGGRIIVRDGVEPDTNKPVRLEFKNKNDILFLTEFHKRWHGGDFFRYKHLDNNEFILNERYLMEFLYTYNWGWDSFDREVREKYGLFSEQSYRNYMEGMFDFEIEHSEQYTQSGYVENLKDKIILRDMNSNRLQLPSSNMLLVVNKKG